MPLVRVRTVSVHCARASVLSVLSEYDCACEALKIAATAVDLLASTVLATQLAAR